MGTILYLAPTFLSYRLHKQIRGVEVFDLLLVKQLVELGHDVTVVADRTWKTRLNERLGASMPRVIFTPPLIKPMWNGLVAAGLVGKRGGRAFDCTFLGNVARGMMPCVEILRTRGVIGHMVVQANRPPRESMAKRIKRWDARVVAVSEAVKAFCPEIIRDRVDVYYGIADPDTWTPPPMPRPDSDKVRFCVVGALHNTWKGADLAIEAYNLLAPDVRARCELHLASYPEGKVPERVQDAPGIVAYTWMPMDKMPGFLRSMDVMLQPSTAQETFCQSMVQGMLTELPVLAYDLPPLTEKLDVGGGMIFRTPSELAVQMTRYAGDRTQRLNDGMIARRTALERYVWDTTVFFERWMKNEVV